MIMYARDPYSALSLEPSRDTKSEKIQETLTFILGYYALYPSFTLNFSNATYIKLSIDDSNIYLNNNGTADIVTCGPGLIPDLDFDDVVTVLVKHVQQCHVD